MNDMMREQFGRGIGLLLIDVQNEFFPGGALPIHGAERVLAVLNGWLRSCPRSDIPVYAARQWHPRGHPSFQTEGGDWPEHCVQDSHGAAFHPALELPPETVVVSTGTRFDRDQVSAFEATGLDAKLYRDGVNELWIGGFAEEGAIVETVRDARTMGFRVRMIPRGTAPLDPQRRESTLEAISRLGVHIDPVLR